MIEGLVSTIIPVHNRDAMLREAVASVLAQTWRPIEIIIVDDGSTDQTPLVMAELQRRDPDIIHLLRQENAGPGAARQAGLQAARGEFVQFLDSDDLLLPNKFSVQVAGLRGDPEAEISYGKTYTRELGARLEKPAQLTGECHRTLFPALLREPLWPTLTPLYRHAFLQTIGPWPVARQLEDWQYDAQAASRNVCLHYADTYVAETRNHGEGRLCHLWKTDVAAMRDRVGAYAQILGHAQRAGLPREMPEMQQFVRSMFWMARSAAAYGLVQESRQLLGLAQAQATRGQWQYRLFALVAAVLGWQRAGQLAELAGRWRR